MKRFIFLIIIFAAIVGVLLADTLVPQVRFHVYRVTQDGTQTEIVNQLISEPNNILDYMPSDFSLAATAARSLTRDEQEILILTIRSSQEFRDALVAVDNLNDGNLKELLVLLIETDWRHADNSNK